MSRTQMLQIQFNDVALGYEKNGWWRDYPSPSTPGIILVLSEKMVWAKAPLLRPCWGLSPQYLARSNGVGGVALQGWAICPK